jgi:hypothetical protein
MPSVIAILNEATHPWSTKRFDIFRSIHTKTIWPFLKINSISSHASDVSYPVEIRIHRLQLEGEKKVNMKKQKEHRKLQTTIVPTTL